MALYGALDHTSSSATLLLSTILLLTVRFVWNNLRSYQLKHQGKCQPPPSVPQKDPFFGLDIIYSRFTENFENRTRDTIARDFFSTYGHTFQSKPFGVPEIVTESPELVKAIYGTDFESFGVGPSRAFGLRPLVRDGGLMTTDGPIWKAHRATLNPIFSKAVGRQEPFDRHIERLLELIPKDGSTIDLQPLFDRLALDSATEILFGESTLTLIPNPPADAVKFLDAFNYLLRGVGIRMVLPSYDFFSRDPKFWSSCKDCQDFVDRILDTVMEEASNFPQVQKYSIAHELAKIMDNRVQIRDQLLGLFLPVHDAIGTPLTNIFFMLARNPAAWAKLRQEINGIGSAKLTPKLLKSLTYLNCVINETLRLYPAISANERIALSDTILPSGGGPDGTYPVFVEKGVKVVLWFSTMARRKDLWGEDAAEWRPERWQNAKPDRWINLSFGAGPRSCPGSELGLIQIGMTMVRLAQKYQILENHDPVEEFIDRWRVTTVSKNGAKVGLRV